MFDLFLEKTADTGLNLDDVIYTTIQYDNLKMFKKLNYIDADLSEIRKEAAYWATRELKSFIDSI